jgi:hypothetical protein
MNRPSLGRLLVAAACALPMLACGVTLAPGGSGACTRTRCPPPAISTAAAHVFTAQGFSFEYFSPWQVSSQDGHTAVVSAATNYGDLTAEFTSTSVTAGTSPLKLLSTATANLDTSQFSGMQDQGPIYGAEIGYVSGAGESYTATEVQPNAPSVPVYLELMASVRGTTGLVFISASTLNPTGPDPTDPRQVPNADYDRMVNSVAWK